MYVKFHQSMPRLDLCHLMVVFGCSILSRSLEILCLILFRLLQFPWTARVKLCLPVLVKDGVPPLPKKGFSGYPRTSWVCIESSTVSMSPHTTLQGRSRPEGEGTKYTGKHQWSESEHTSQNLKELDRLIDI